MRSACALQPVFDVKYNTPCDSLSVSMSPVVHERMLRSVWGVRDRLALSVVAAHGVLPPAEGKTQLTQWAIERAVVDMWYSAVPKTC